MRFLTVTLLLIGSQLFGQKISKDSFYITGNFTDMADGVTVQVFHPSSQVEVGKAIANKKKFKIVGTVPFAGIGRIQFTDGKSLNKSVDYFFGNENIAVNGTLADPKKWFNKGAISQIIFNQFIALFENDFKLLNEANSKLVSTTDFNARVPLQKKFDDQKAKTIQKMEGFIARNKISPVAAFALYVTRTLFDDTQVTQLNYLAGTMTGTATTSPYYTELKRELEAKMFGSIGSVATDFTQNDTAGKPVTLSSFRGKYVLLDFWASWCGPCRMENPNVVAAYNKFKIKNFTILGVSLDRPGYKDAWIQAIKEDGLAWTNVSDLKFWQNEAAQLYKVGGIPQNFLIDPNGKIVGKNLRGPALEEKLCELLGCN